MPKREKHYLTTVTNNTARWSFYSKDVATFNYLLFTRHYSFPHQSRNFKIPPLWLI